MKRTSMSKVAVATLLVVVVLGGTASGFEAIPIGPAVVFSSVGLATDAQDWEAGPSIDGRLVAWTEWAGPDPELAMTNIAIRNLATGETRRIGANDGHHQAYPRVSGDRVVYEDNTSGNFDIKMYSWKANAVTVVRASALDESGAHIDGNIVLWRDANGLLWYRDYDMAGATAVQITAASDNADDWEVDNGRIVWDDGATNSLHVFTPRAPGFDGMLIDYSDPIMQPDLHGDRIAYTRRASGEDDALVYNIQSRAAGTISALAGVVEQSPTVFHDTFAWVKPGVGEWDIGYSRPRRFGSTISGGESDGNPTLFGHRVAYSRRSAGVFPDYDLDIMLATGDTKLTARTAGANRYATAALVSQAYFAGAKRIVLCTGENFPDALAAAPLARALEAPLLLTRKDSLPPETLAEIQRLDPDIVYIIGGTPTISAAVEAQLDATYDVGRIAGANRYETSALIAAKLQTAMGSGFVFRAFVTRGDNFPDALAVGPIAAGALAPILLVQTNAVPASVATAIDDLNITLGYVIGDTKSVSAGTFTALRNLITANGAAGTIAERWAGPNRYDTAAIVIENGLAYRWIDLDTLGVAVGTKFPDALGGGAALGHYGSPVILTNGTALSPAVSTFLANHHYDIGRVDVFGDTSSVSAGVFNAIMANVK